MKNLIILIISLSLLFGLILPTEASATAYVEDEVLIVFKSTTTNDTHTLAQDLDIAQAEPIATSDSIYKLSLKNGESVKQAIKRLDQNPMIKSVQPNYIYRISAFTPDDPLYPHQWNFEQINVASAWERDQTEPLYGGDSDVIVAVLDTGVAYENYNEFSQAPDLAETNFTAGYDYVNDDSHPNDDNGHGTHITGTIAQSTNNGVASAGIAFNTTIMPIKVLASNGEGTSDVIIRGIQYAIDNGADVINMSFGSTENEDEAYAAIIETAADQGIIMVAAAGNAGASTLQFPASHEKVIGIGATQYIKTRSVYSNYGAGLDLMAPGGDISEDQDSDGIPDGIVQQSFAGMAGGQMDYSDFTNIWVEGTSSAAAHASGAIALLLAYGVPAENIQSILESTAEDLGETGYDTEYGFGLIDLESAFELVAGDSTPPTTLISNNREPDISTDYYLQSPAITLTASDNMSEIMASYYRWDDADYSLYTEPIYAPEGTHTLYYYSVDVPGNIETAITSDYTIDTRRVVTGANTGGGPQVRAFSTRGVVTASFFAYPSVFRGGVNIALGDVDGDGQTEIITAAGPGGGPHIRIFSLSGTFEKDFFAYNSSFRGGVNLAVGDVDGGKDEIITAPMSGGGPNVRIFGYRNGEFQPTTENFMAYDSNFRGGVSLAVADLEGNGISEIITAPLSSGGPQIRIFGFRAGVFEPVILGMMAYAENFRGGLTLTGGDVDGDGREEIITGIASRGGPHVRIFGRQSDQTLALENSGFMAFSPDFRGGINLATSDYQADGKKEIVVSVRSNGNPVLRFFKPDGTQIYQEFMAYAETFKNGVNLATNQ